MKSAIPRPEAFTATPKGATGVSKPPTRRTTSGREKASRSTRRRPPRNRPTPRRTIPCAGATRPTYRPPSGSDAAAQSSTGVLADRIFPDRSLCPAQRGEPERSLSKSLSAEISNYVNIQRKKKVFGAMTTFSIDDGSTLGHSRTQQRIDDRKDPDEPQQQLRQTQHPIECQHFLPLENFRTVDPVVQRLGQIRTRRPGRLAGRHDGLDTRPASQTAQRRRQPQLFVRRQSGLPLQTGKKGFGQRLIQLQPRLRPLETAGGRFPLRPAGRRRHGQLLPLHDRHLHAQPANQPAIPERRRLDNGRTGRSALRHRPQRALPQGGALPAGSSSSSTRRSTSRSASRGSVFRSTWPPSRR